MRTHTHTHGRKDEHTHGRTHSHIRVPLVNSKGSTKKKKVEETNILQRNVSALNRSEAPISGESRGERDRKWEKRETGREQIPDGPLPDNTHEENTPYTI